MNKENFLRKSFHDKYGDNLGIIETKILNILIHLVNPENISIEDIAFFEDKIVVNSNRKIDEEENVSGKYIIYNNAKYAYLEKNKNANTIIGMEYDHGMCGIYYKSTYDKFDVERTVGFKIRKNKYGLTFIENDDFNMPLYKCYPLAYEDFSCTKNISDAIGLMISNDMYNVIDFDIKNKQTLVKKRNKKL